jgi:hypothetical protein
MRSETTPAQMPNNASIGGNKPVADGVSTPTTATTTLCVGQDDAFCPMPE